MVWAYLEGLYFMLASSLFCQHVGSSRLQTRLLSTIIQINQIGVITSQQPSATL